MWQFWQRGCCKTFCTVANAPTAAARLSAALSGGVAGRNVGRVLNPSAAEGGRSAATDGLRTRPTLGRARATASIRVNTDIAISSGDQVERQLAQTPAGQHGESVRHRGGDRRNADLSDTAHLLG